MLSNDWQNISRSKEALKSMVDLVMNLNTFNERCNFWSTLPLVSESLCPVNFIVCSVSVVFIIQPEEVKRQLLSLCISKANQNCVLADSSTLHNRNWHER